MGGPVSGVLQVLKSTGEVIVRQPMPGDSEKRIFVRAAAAIHRHWRKGEYPQTASHIAG